MKREDYIQADKDKAWRGGHAINRTEMDRHAIKSISPTGDQVIGLFNACDPAMR